MAINRLALDEAWHNLIKVEDEYYELLATYALLKEGNLTYTKQSVSEKTDYIKHHYPELSVLLNPLSDKELLCVYYAACGKEVKETAITLRVSESFIKQLRASAFHKLRAKNLGRALSNAMRYGYLPLKDSSSFLNSVEKELDFLMLKKLAKNHFEKKLKTTEVENTPI